MTYLFLVMITMTGTLTTACSSSDDEPATPVQKANTLTVEAGMSDNITRALADYSGQKGTCTSRGGSAVHSNLSKKTDSDTSYTWHLNT